MEQENKIAKEEQEDAGEMKKNKGSTPKGKPDCTTRKLTSYITEKEHQLLIEFAKTAWHTFNYSGAARYLVLQSLKEWVRKGKKEVR